MLPSREMFENETVVFSRANLCSIKEELEGLIGIRQRTTRKATGMNRFFAIARELAYIEVVQHQHKGAIETIVADIANGYFYGLTCIVGQ